MNKTAKYLRSLATALAVICAIAASAGGPRTLSAALDSLDDALMRRTAVSRLRHRAIDSLKAVYAETGQYRDAAAIGDAYRGLNVDSALYYFHTSASMASAAADTAATRRSMIEYAGLLGKAGHFTEALDILGKMPKDSLQRIERLRYYDLRSQIYIDCLNSARFIDRERYTTATAVATLDTLRSMLPPRSIGRRLTDAMRHNLNGDSTLAEGEIKEFFDSIPVNHPLYGIASGLMAGIYRNRPDKSDEYLYYLTLASTADARNAGGEAYTLETLGSEIFKRGDFERAYTYLTVSGEAINELGTRRRLKYESPAMDTLLDSMHRREHSRQVAFVVTLCLLGVVIITFVVTMLRVARRSRRQQGSVQKIAAVSAAKDKYISQLLELCTSLYDSMEDFNKLVGRKIMANQTRDLYQAVESGKIMRRQTEKFFTVFDESVFNVYPDFVEEINSLLQPDKRITLTEPGVLTPELRIVAFMRLGITDSNRISKFLGLSLNTVYTYRNRMKSRAIKRDTFESDILKNDETS